MTKLVDCKTCGKSIAKTAKKCPSCGARNKRTSKFTIFIGLLFALAIAIAMIGQQQSGVTPQPVVQQPTVSVDCSKKDERAELMQKMVNDGYWESVSFGVMAKVRAMPTFTNSVTFKDKEKFMSMVAAANHCNGGEIGVRLINAMTDEELGFYSKYGLKLEK